MFNTPDFNLTAAVYRMTVPYDFATKVFSADLPCQLRGFGQHPKDVTILLVSSVAIWGEIYVLFPQGSDVRDISCGSGSDLLEVPAGSGRWYLVVYVDDVAKGFTNEYRSASVIKIFGDDGASFRHFPPWPAPIP
jgi:hypothetical protein